MFSPVMKPASTRIAPRLALSLMHASLLLSFQLDVYHLDRARHGCPWESTAQSMRYRSSTNFSLFEPEQQIIIFSLEACSALVKQTSR
jgi:hypothetical protein